VNCGTSTFKSKIDSPDHKVAKNQIGLLEQTQQDWLDSLLPIKSLLPWKPGMRFRFTENLVAAPKSATRELLRSTPS